MLKVCRLTGVFYCFSMPINICSIFFKRANLTEILRFYNVSTLLYQALCRCNVADIKRIQSLLSAARVARLATIDFEEAKPHIVPVVFAFDGDYYYIPLDKKLKRDSNPERLRRVRNIKKNPNVALLIDEYNEDWSKLFFVMIQGKGVLIRKFNGQDDLKKVREIDRLWKYQPRLQRHKHNNNNRSQSILKYGQNLLLEKYPQYRKIGLGDMCIVIWPVKIFTWKMNSGEFK
jgi:PPOX class probable F420-dependent enzyme